LFLPRGPAFAMAKPDPAVNEQHARWFISASQTPLDQASACAASPASCGPAGRRYCPD